MVYSISPNYYAAGENIAEFELIGGGFDLLPDDAIGNISENNNNPLDNLAAGGAYYHPAIIERTDKRIVFRGVSHNYPRPYYLGAIVSSDKQIIYWRNESSPIPN